MPRTIAEVRRPEIVWSLYRALQKVGITFPSYDQIAREGDMSRQLVRHYFNDPEEMAVALCDALAATYKDALMRGIIMADESRRLRTFLDFYFDMLAPRGLPKPTDDQVYDALFALAGTCDRVRENLKGQYSLLQMTVAHEVQISHPHLSQRACAELGFLLVALMYGHWKLVATLGFSRDYNRVSRDAMDRLIESYCARYDDPDA